MARGVVKPYRCTVCGAEYFVPRRAERLRGEWHKKDMWCYKCGKRQKFVEREYISLDEVMSGG